mmetsp:Transcript_13250/g.20567  ORF Transcript_13250/g.20567 Transcript_13250/m.20567 type:complete len:578 (+) Transcript_13250:190-1923(+)|eukprot:CAMPEP_0194218626 /NCGR_PEP_ID=MMETSP0156-20130528/24192_1 /TAXON_ID=33649 /ORGANISM="Thalassionema nitzschioides, Strain L26-B" /LENGTH=577 /DNA_ID=CAMNT_0038948047 /DNA_START=180 /DNA_END=1913 /DNA_ORIENTATION=+
MASPPSRKKRPSMVVMILGFCCFIILSINFLHVSILHDAHSIEDFIQEQHKLHEHPTTASKQQKQLGKHSLAGLNCLPYGGPASEQATNEMVYWQDVPTDNQYHGPFHSDDDDNKKYMTFEPDGGGWNNIRMAMETVLAMAHAMGRTLVLPPEARMYLLTTAKGSKNENQKAEFTFSDFFHMDSIAQEHEHFDIISMEEFLQREGNNLKAKGWPKPPPNNRTNWNGQTQDINQKLYPYLRNVGYQPDWDVQNCLAAFPATSSDKDIVHLQKMEQQITRDGWPSFERYVGHPTPVNGPPDERLKENAAGRKKLCIYNTTLQQEKLIHFSGKPSEPGGRLLVHFYAFLYFQDWQQDLWMKRFVRDHVRYVDELQCAAARVVQAIREHVKKRQRGKVTTNITNPELLYPFDTFHIRRGDFQYKETRLDAIDIYNRAKDVIPEGSTVYIATDEHSPHFFALLKEKYDVLFLDDFKEQFHDLNTNYYGMLDQLIASKGRYFFGCWFSTFTGYINRLRGYHADKQKLLGYEQGLIESYYYARLKPDDKLRMRKFYPVKQAFHAREFPASWRQIDMGMEHLQVA